MAKFKLSIDADIRFPSIIATVEAQAEVEAFGYVGRGKLMLRKRVSQSMGARIAQGNAFDLSREEYAELPAKLDKTDRG
jgi:hypothetical protein